jgi:osmotically-inducible protein OsmY
MRTEQDIALDVTDRLRATPGLEHQDIAIRVIDGTVLLAGIVRSSSERLLAEQVAKGVPGVIGLTNCLGVCLRSASSPPDPEITREAVATLRHQLPSYIDALQVTVQNGHVAVEGTLDWYYQRDLVDAMLRALRGVTRITNLIHVHEPPLADDSTGDIKAP